jgi:hypothetical protein
MSKAERFMKSLQKQHLVIKAQPVEDVAKQLIRDALKQFNLKVVGREWVGVGENALELRPLRDDSSNLPPPLLSPIAAPDPNGDSVLLIFAVPTNVETDSY